MFKKIVLILISILSHLICNAQKVDSLYILETDSSNTVSFWGGESGYVAHGIVSLPISFSINVPKNYVDYLYNPFLFGFFYPDNEQVLIATRQFNRSIDSTSCSKIDKTKIFSIQDEHFNSFYEESDFEHFRSIQENRIHYLIIKNGTIIFLYNIKPENEKFYLDIVNSFEEQS